jgi:hypothetical protein
VGEDEIKRHRNHCAIEALRTARGVRMAEPGPVNQRKEKIMDNTQLIILIVVLLILFGGGGGYFWTRRR